MLQKGVEPIKVMIMGGWKDIKTMQLYVRKAGVDIKGITNCLDLHSPTKSEPGKLLNLANVVHCSESRNEDNNIK